MRRTKPKPHYILDRAKLAEAQAVLNRQMRNGLELLHAAGKKKPRSPFRAGAKSRA